VEVCGTCHAYLKTVDTWALSRFPLLSLSDLETMDLDMAAMEHGYQRPSLKSFATKR
jgi:formate dehydrogenase maturation protein FdhE